jgi:hypothetical protein
MNCTRGYNMEWWSWQIPCLHLAPEAKPPHDVAVGASVPRSNGDAISFFKNTDTINVFFL